MDSKEAQVNGLWKEHGRQKERGEEREKHQYTPKDDITLTSSYSIKTTMSTDTNTHKHKHTHTHTHMIYFPTSYFLNITLMYELLTIYQYADWVTFFDSDVIPI